MPNAGFIGTFGDPWSSYEGIQGAQAQRTQAGQARSQGIMQGRNLALNRDRLAQEQGQFAAVQAGAMADRMEAVLKDLPPGPMRDAVIEAMTRARQQQGVVGIPGAAVVEGAEAVRGRAAAGADAEAKRKVQLEQEKARIQSEQDKAKSGYKITEDAAREKAQGEEARKTAGSAALGRVWENILDPNARADRKHKEAQAAALGRAKPTAGETEEDKIRARQAYGDLSELEQLRLAPIKSALSDMFLTPEQRVTLEAALAQEVKNIMAERAARTSQGNALSGPGRAAQAQPQPQGALRTATIDDARKALREAGGDRTLAERKLNAMGLTAEVQ